MRFFSLKERERHNSPAVVGNTQNLIVTSLQTLSMRSRTASSSHLTLPAALLPPPFPARPLRTTTFTPTALCPMSAFSRVIRCWLLLLMLVVLLLLLLLRCTPRTLGREGPRDKRRWLHRGVRQQLLRRHHRRGRKNHHAPPHPLEIPRGGTVG